MSKRTLEQTLLMQECVKWLQRKTDTHLSALIDSAYSIGFKVEPVCVKLFIFLHSSVVDKTQSYHDIVSQFKSDGDNILDLVQQCHPNIQHIACQINADMVFPRLPFCTGTLVSFVPKKETAGFRWLIKGIVWCNVHFKDHDLDIRVQLSSNATLTDLRNCIEDNEKCVITHFSTDLNDNVTSLHDVEWRDDFEMHVTATIRQTYTVTHQWVEKCLQRLEELFETGECISCVLNAKHVALNARSVEGQLELLLSICDSLRPFEIKKMYTLALKYLKEQVGPFLARMQLKSVAVYVRTFDKENRHAKLLRTMTAPVLSEGCFKFFHTPGNIKYVFGQIDLVKMCGGEASTVTVSPESTVADVCEDKCFHTGDVSYGQQCMMSNIHFKTAIFHCI